MGHDPVAQKRKRSIDEEQIPDAMCDAAIAEAPKEVSRVLLHSEHWHDFIYEELLLAGDYLHAAREVVKDSSPRRSAVGRTQERARKVRPTSP